MKKILKKLSVPIWLGFSLGICDVPFYEWQFYVVIVPTLALYFWNTKQ